MTTPSISPAQAVEKMAKRWQEEDAARRQRLVEHFDRIDALCGEIQEGIDELMERLPAARELAIQGLPPEPENDRPWETADPGEAWRLSIEGLSCPVVTRAEWLGDELVFILPGDHVVITTDPVIASGHLLNGDAE